jgi:hypothetical protein
MARMMVDISLPLLVTGALGELEEENIVGSFTGLIQDSDNII